LKQVFIYGGGSERQNGNVSDYLDTELHTNLIINTTPDQHVYLDNHKVLYNKIRTIKCIYRWVSRIYKWIQCMKV
jgi:hypothetical protein